MFKNTEKMNNQQIKTMLTQFKEEDETEANIDEISNLFKNGALYIEGENCENIDEFEKEEETLNSLTWQEIFDPGFNMGTKYSKSKLNEKNTVKLENTSAMNAYLIEV